MAAEHQAHPPGVARGGLREPRRRRKRQRLGESTVPASPLVAERPDHVWAIAFQWDQTADGHNLKLLHVVDEFTREALAIECRRRIDSDHTVDVLDRLVAERGTAPGFLRCVATSAYGWSGRHSRFAHLVAIW